MEIQDIKIYKHKSRHGEVYQVALKINTENLRIKPWIEIETEISNILKYPRHSETLKQKAPKICSWCLSVANSCNTPLDFFDV